MTNGEKFKQTFGFGVDGSRVIAVNSKWWDCEFQNRKPMNDELVKKLRDAATMSEALAILLPNSGGNPIANLYKEAADAIETLHDLLTDKCRGDCPLVPVPEYERLKRRVVYRGDVYNALESARIIALDDFGVGKENRYKDGFHDGLKRALEILANEVQDVPIIIPAEEDER